MKDFIRFISLFSFIMISYYLFGKLWRYLL